MNSKLLGSILLIVGTSIGAGMLALPIATAELGFIGSIILLVGCWIVMTAGAFLLLEVNLWLPLNSNLISMAGATIGPVGQIISWITYLLLLYSLLCAYIAGGSDLFHNLLLSKHIELPIWASSIVFTFLFSSVVFFGIRSVDYVNRGLMFVKFSAFFLLVFFLSRFINTENLFAGSFSKMGSATAIMVTITSFGYAAIVPSLRIYLHGDTKQLKKAIFIGSLVPLVCYIMWDAAIMGVLPLQGEHGLINILHSDSSTSGLVNSLSSVVATNTVSIFTKLFTSICVLTSFLGVSLCLTDFLADGFQLEKTGKSGFLIHLLTFLPPLTMVLFFPNAFIKALEYAGIYCVILLILLPALMAWFGRYHRNKEGFKVYGGKLLLMLMTIVSVILIAYSFFG